ncbi:hypothetical protein PCE1_001604 [Barthelona sp. PCE]
MSDYKTFKRELESIITPTDPKSVKPEEIMDKLHVILKGSFNGAFTHALPTLFNFTMTEQRALSIFNDIFDDDRYPADVYVELVRWCLKNIPGATIRDHIQLICVNIAEQKKSSHFGVVFAYITGMVERSDGDFHCSAALEAALLELLTQKKNCVNFWRCIGALYAINRQGSPFIEHILHIGFLSGYTRVAKSLSEERLVIIGSVLSRANANVALRIIASVIKNDTSDDLHMTHMLFESSRTVFGVCTSRVKLKMVLSEELFTTSWFIDFYTSFTDNAFKITCQSLHLLFFPDEHSVPQVVSRLDELLQSNATASVSRSYFDVASGYLTLQDIKPLLIVEPTYARNVVARTLYHPVLSRSEEVDWSDVPLFYRLISKNECPSIENDINHAILARHELYIGEALISARKVVPLKLFSIVLDLFKANVAGVVGMAQNEVKKIVESRRLLSKEEKLCLIECLVEYLMPHTPSNILLPSMTILAFFGKLIKERVSKEVIERIINFGIINSWQLVRDAALKILTLVDFTSEEHSLDWLIERSVEGGAFSVSLQGTAALATVCDFDMQELLARAGSFFKEFDLDVNTEYEHVLRVYRTYLALLNDNPLIKGVQGLCDSVDSMLKVLGSQMSVHGDWSHVTGPGACYLSCKEFLMHLQRVFHKYNDDQKDMLIKSVFNICTVCRLTPLWRLALKTVQHLRHHIENVWNLITSNVNDIAHFKHTRRSGGIPGLFCMVQQLSWNGDFFISVCEMVLSVNEDISLMCHAINIMAGIVRSSRCFTLEIYDGLISSVFQRIALLFDHPNWDIRSACTNSLAPLIAYMTGQVSSKKESLRVMLPLSFFLERFSLFDFYMNQLANGTTTIKLLLVDVLMMLDMTENHEKTQRIKEVLEELLTHRNHMLRSSTLRLLRTAGDENREPAIDVNEAFSTREINVPLAENAPCSNMDNALVTFEEGAICERLMVASVDDEDLSSLLLLLVFSNDLPCWDAFSERFSTIFGSEVTLAPHYIFSRLNFDIASVPTAVMEHVIRMNCYNRQGGDDIVHVIGGTPE